MTIVVGCQNCSMFLSNERERERGGRGGRGGEGLWLGGYNNRHIFSALLRSPIIIFLSYSVPFPSGFATEQRAVIRFRPTASWLFAVPELMTASDRVGNPVEVLLSRGKWKLVMKSDISNVSLNLLLVRKNFF